ncbi:MAG TPA: ABC transporter substrate-binding protein [Nitrosopumilaceae archaeon]|nr:ABC transporter substrate-binding protein [Nitrosopumilaceae archaeon]
MNPLLILCCVVFVFGSSLAFAEKGTFVDKVQFIQYSDDNTAFEEVKNGNLDIYYWAIPFERITDPQSREGLKIFQSTGQSYSLLVNPASSEKFNPFSIKDVRFALNYLVDRNLIVDELLGGYGVPMVSAYKPFDPDYLLILDELESFNFRYNPALAEKMISDSLSNAGAKKIGSKWYYDSKPIEITIFIRSDDQIRKSIGEVISSQLEKIGFSVKRDYGDLNKAFTIVYGSNPSDLKWNIYTEGWAASGFVKYDSVLTAQMYSPWFSNMPGFGNPSYWNYKDDYMDSISQNIFLGNFTSAQQRTELLKKAVDEGIKESVRVFLVSKIDQFVSSNKVDGIINDFGAGITSRFTPINARDNSDSLRIGVHKIYQGAWNPIGGFSDSASQQILGAISDPGSFKNPFTGVTIPVRSSWKVETAGPAGKLDVPSDAIKWDAIQQKWIQVGNGMNATSKVTFHLTFGNWHNGQPMDMNDVLYSIYFLYQWGAEPSENSKTFDSEYSPKANQSANTLIGIRVIDKNTIEVYQNYWHFDEGEIAASADVFPLMPWELFYAMEKSVTDGKVAFSRSEAVSKNVDWLSLIVPNNANMIKSNLEDFSKSNSIPVALAGFGNDSKYYSDRYLSSISWIEKHNHAVISDGPFYLDSYSPEARIITIKAFDDPTYPFGAGYWKKFENINVAKINGVDVPTTVSLGKELTIPISVTPNCTIYYYFLNADGKGVDSGMLQSGTGNATIILPKEKSSLLSLGANDLKIFAVSESALKPDIFYTSFLGIQGESPVMPEIIPESGAPIVSFDYVVIGIVLAAIAIGVVIILKKRKKP